MTPARWAQVKALLSATLDLPATQRAEFLAREPDAELVQEVRSLLVEHERPGGFLDTVTHEFRSQAFAAPSAAGNRIGERIGSYRIAGVLGTGGMGDVFKAVRDDDQYEAQVAIKLMRADMRSALTEQRFKVERQILAGLDHRNIARLLDGGTTAAGMPYVVMELVAGEPIDGYCDARQLKVRERVQLFLQVCAAVSYAHQHLVVHRDLKPNNILVTADGSVKLLDFGIAKLLESNADTMVPTASTTATTLRAMTLEYASPEQVSGGNVTTVSDVYSLGVVLYRLLTGKSPYRERTNDAQRMAEILSDTSPTRPSQVEHRIDGDLDNILLMALRKEPQRRYGSVEQFANDLRNFLAGMPVQARGNSLRYRTGKFIRRRKVEIAAGLVVGCALLAALGISLRETREAERQRLVAQEHFDSVRKLANTMLFELHDEIAKVPGSVRTREILVKTSLEYLDSLYRKAGTDSTLRQELGIAYARVGDIQGKQVDANLGDQQSALRSYARAIEMLEPLVAANPDNHAAGIKLAGIHVTQASVLLVAARSAEALVSVDKGVVLTEKLQSFYKDDAERAGQLAAAYWAKADILAMLDRPAETVVAIDALLAVSENFLRANPDDEAALALINTTYNNASMHVDRRLSEPEQHEHAMLRLRRSAWASERLLALQPDNLERRADLAITQANIGRLLVARGDYAGALKLYQPASRALRAAVSDPNDARTHWLIALTDSDLGNILFHLGRIDEARPILIDCQSTLDRLQKQGPSLRVEYALGQTGARLGALHSHLAEDPSLTSAKRLAHWRQALQWLRPAVASLKNVDANVALEPIDQKSVDDAIAALVRAEAATAGT